jgi:hypothetical protein
MYEFSLEDLESSPEFQNSPPEVQKALSQEYVAQNGPDEALKQYQEAISDPEYKTLPPEDQKLFNKQYFDFYGLKKGFFENIKDLTISGGESALDAARIADDVATGKIDANTAELIAQGIKRDELKTVPDELKSVYESVKGPSEEFDKAQGFVESAKAVGSMAKAVGKEAVTNPKGMAYMTAEQLANMAPGMAGMLTGAKAGGVAGSAVAPGVGTAVGGTLGGIVGAFAGQWGIEAGSEFTGMVISELQARKVKPTKENIEAILADDTFLAKAFDNARDKATATSAVSSLFALGSGRISSAPMRAATRCRPTATGTSGTRPSP